MLIELDRELENEFMNKFIGRTMKVLYEQEHSGSGCLYEGYTPNYIKVVLKSNSDIEEKIIDTKLTEVKNGVIVGGFI